MPAARLPVAGIVFGIAVTLFADSTRAQRPIRTLRPNTPSVDAPCGTAPRDRERSRAVTGLTDGEALSFDQDPPVVYANHAGSVTLRNFEVAGDYATVRFRRAPTNSDDGEIETWSRVATRAVDGRLISIFEPSWPEVTLGNALSGTTAGYDSPELYWGSYLPPRSSTPRFIYLRLGLGGIPHSAIVRVTDRVQYASNVVNLVIPGFGDGRVSAGSQAFELSAVSHAFYEYFSDRYDVLAVVPQSTPVSDYGAFHRNVQNRVSGLNLDLFNDSVSYGSGSVLQGIEVYAGATAARFRETNHEMAHQWGSNFDWGRIAGIARGGHEPRSHAPLWTGGETLLGAVLYGDRRVRALAAGYAIEKTPAPAQFHPIELYAMGKLPAREVPEFGVFEEQEQFDTLTPAVGTTLHGGVRRVNILDIVREHGARDGPAPSEWRRATVLVSRDGLASAAEMDYWNFFAQRLADRSQHGLAAIDGYVPFRTATRNTVSLSTAISPQRQTALVQMLDTDTPPFGPEDFRGVTFSSAVPSRYTVNVPVTLNGRVSNTLVDVTEIELLFWRDGGDSVSAVADVNRSGDFSLPITFSATQRGRYNIAAYLFWPESGPRYPTTSLTAVTVE